MDRLDGKKVIIVDLRQKYNRVRPMTEYCEGRLFRNPIHDNKYYYVKTKQLNQSVKKVKVDLY